jgi:hypothetical protein
MIEENKKTTLNSKLIAIHREPSRLWVESLNNTLKSFEGELRDHIGASSFYDEALRNLITNETPRNESEIRHGMHLVGDWLIDKGDGMMSSLEKVNDAVSREFHA